MGSSLKTGLDSLLEALVLPSFTSLGPVVRRRLFDWQPLESLDLSGRTVVLTGGTSGIGETAANLLAGLGATLVVIGRSRDKTHALVEDLIQRSGNVSISAVIADLGERDDVRAAANELLAAHPCIDVLMHNAGALFNKRRRAANGTDLSVELMVATPFLLTGLLLPSLKRSSPARVITMSSGGMYTQPLTVGGLEMTDVEYQGAKQYARAKRAQVVLNEMWSERIATSDVRFHALHPGWVDTPGINDALPGFSRILSPLRLLRSGREGADTMVWLAGAELGDSSGEFWLDRAVRSTHKMQSSREAESAERRDRLWQWCEDHTDWRLADH